ncbi:MAG: ribbon-helix-helix protein, CopG family [Gammaproteobacteria bacterium]|nr:ribbon-helix-helix protein, CopG family [Gammaproteobacteria bacterium]
MRTIQITIDDELLERVDERAKRLGSTRGGFARDALRAALARYEESEAEERHIVGYRRIPPAPQEFAVQEEDRAWGGDLLDAWNDE